MNLIKYSWMQQKHQTKELFWSVKHNSKVKKYTEYLLSNYKDTLLYLKDDFGQRKFVVKDSKGMINPVIIDEELEDIDFQRDKLKGSFIPPLRRRYYLFRILHNFVSQTLNILKDFCGENQYKTINFKKYNDRLNEMNKIIIPSF